MAAQSARHSDSRFPQSGGCADRPDRGSKASEIPMIVPAGRGEKGLLGKGSGRRLRASARLGCEGCGTGPEEGRLARSEAAEEVALLIHTFDARGASALRFRIPCLLLRGAPGVVGTSPSLEGAASGVTSFLPGPTLCANLVEPKRRILRCAALTVDRDLRLSRRLGDLPGGGHGMDRHQPKDQDEKAWRRKARGGRRAATGRLLNVRHCLPVDRVSRVAGRPMRFRK